ncbi:MAG: hypothetical protein AB1401_00770 [Thermodesulfobacteriota bacterium]
MKTLAIAEGGNGKHFALSAHVLYRCLIYEKRYRLQEVARKIRLPVSTLYKYCQGIYACPVEILKRIFTVTQDIEILELLKPDGYDFIRAEKCTGAPMSTVEVEFNDDFLAVSKVVDAYRLAKEDGKIDERETEILDRLLDIAKCEIEETRQVISSEIGKEGRGR